MEAVLKENRFLKEEIAVLRAQIEWLKKKLFGGGHASVIEVEVEPVTTSR